MMNLKFNINQLFGAWKKEDQDMIVINIQKKFIWILIIFCLICLSGWITSPSRLTVYIPPEIENGATMKAGEIPKPLVYSFAYQIWQEINLWSQDGSKDYVNNIHTYWSYLTPSFKSDLLQDAEALKNAGQLQRQRFLHGLSGAAFDPATIKKINSDTWEVDLKMHLLEYNNNQTVKDVEILYPLKVTRMNISQTNNPYGLVLAGFVSNPIRLKTTI